MCELSTWETMTISPSRSVLGNSWHESDWYFATRGGTVHRHQDPVRNL